MDFLQGPKDDHTGSGDMERDDCNIEGSMLGLFESWVGGGLGGLWVGCFWELAVI